MKRGKRTFRYGCSRFPKPCSNLALAYEGCRLGEDAIGAEGESKGGWLGIFSSEARILAAHLVEASIQYVGEGKEELLFFIAVLASSSSSPSSLSSQ